MGVVTLVLYHSALVKVTDSSSFSASLQKRKLKMLELNANAQQTTRGKHPTQMTRFPLKAVEILPE